MGSSCAFSCSKFLDTARALTPLKRPKKARVYQNKNLSRPCRWAKLIRQHELTLFLMILSIDVGSTGIRAILVNPEGGIVASEYKRIKQFFPRLGWLEHDLNDIWAQCLAVCGAIVAVAPSDISLIKGIAITTQRNTLAVWDRQSGEPILPAISWSDNRTRDLCRILGEKDVSGLFRKRAGRELTTTSIGLRLCWILDTDTGLKERLLSQTTLWGTLDTWLVWKLTGGAVWATDYSNAATTSIYDLVDRQWSDPLMEMLDLPAIPMPDVRPTMGDYGETSKNIFGRSIPIACVVGDQYASLFGQGCVVPGMAKCTLGTGGFCIVNIGHKPLDSIEGITTRICWHFGENTTYGFEGVVLHIGTLLDWLCNKMRFVRTLAQTSRVGAGEESRGVYIVPAFSGLASPCWDPDAKAIISGAFLRHRPSAIGARWIGSSGFPSAGHNGGHAKLLRSRNQIAFGWQRRHE